MEKLPSMPSTSGARSDQFRRNVFLLKNGDFERINGQVHMPTKSEMATIRARTGQYKRDVEFYASMSSDVVKNKLEETFPYLKNKGFFCAAKNNLDSDFSRLDFAGSQHVWDGKAIRRKIQGNSALYIFEDDHVDTSGISGSDPEPTQEEWSGCIQWLQDNLHFEISIYPTESPLEGGALCRFTFNPELHPEITSGRATFENLATVQLERLRNGSLLGTIPASPVPGLVSVILESQHGILLGQTNIKYYGMEEVLKQIVRCPGLMERLFEECNMVYGLGETNEIKNSGILGITQPVQLLRLLVYTAAKVGAQQFIEIIFNSSAGRVVFDAYKDSSQLPEVIAKDNGNEETAHYLERITKRFSNEISSGQECSQTIDWSELVKAAEVAQKKLDLTNEKENGQVKSNDPKETGYLGDVDTSSNEASAPQSSDSEDDISTTTTTTTTTTTRKGSFSGRECQIGLKRDPHREDRKGDTEDPIAGETLHQFEVEDIPSTSDFMKEIRRTKNILTKTIRFSDLSKAQKQEDSKDLEELGVKANKLKCKATDTIESLRTSASKLDKVWKDCKKVHATGKVGSIAGGLLAVAGGIATVMTGGAASPLLMAGMGLGAAGVATDLVTSLKEASINSSETKKAEKNLQDTRDSINDVNNTLHVWMDKKEDVRLLYICCLAEVSPDRNDLVIKLLQNVVLRTLIDSVNAVGVTRVALSSGVFFGIAGQAAAQAVTKGLAGSGTKAAGQVASKLMIGVTAAFVVYEAVDLTYTIKDIIQDKGSDAARSLRQKANELERAFQISSKD